MAVKRKRRKIAERGTVKAFVTKHVNFATDLVADELKRLVGLAAKKGVKTTPGSIQAAYYRLKKEANPDGASPAKKRKRSRRRGAGRKENPPQSKTLAGILAKIADVLRGIEPMLVKNEQLAEENRALKAEAKAVSHAKRELKKFVRVHLK